MVNFSTTYWVYTCASSASRWGHEKLSMAKCGRWFSFSTSALESPYCFPPPILFTGQETEWITQVLSRKSSPVTVSLPLASFLYASSPLSCSLPTTMSCCSLPILFTGRQISELKRGTWRKVHKLFVNSYTLVVNPLQTFIQTYMQNLRQRPH